ncbi:hypothetical protein [Brucella sp. NBRC 113783]|uniref:hypothetical protein n=1 Tax=Brucella sp. NBRC 113783 TaxID=3075478 RepID=UPI0029C012E0|nr:hypothetical protein [Brucella sp. NBRC 113783]MDX4074829.1 hypothetical protein [Brucella sp. NBRC 113783]
MAKSSSYQWDLPSPYGIQIVEIGRVATTISAIDIQLKAFETAFLAHTHAFDSLTGKPTTLAGYGIADGMTADEIATAIQKLKDDLVNGSGAALDTLKELADALDNDPNFATTMSNALGLRVRVDAANGFSLAQKAQGRVNLDALGTVDKGVANGVASLDSTGKVPSAQLPGLTTTETVGAAVAGANGGSSIADGDTLTGVLSGTSTLRRWTWGNIKAWIKAYLDPFYEKALGFTPVRQGFSGSTVHIGWNAGSIQLHVDNTTFGATWPMSISGRANGGANWADGATYADRLGPGGWTLATVQDQLNWRVTDHRFAGYITQEVLLDGGGTSGGGGSSGYVVTHVTKRAGVAVADVGLRQPQMYIPNAGWRALGGW